MIGGDLGGTPGSQLDRRPRGCSKRGNSLPPGFPLAPGLFRGIKNPPDPLQPWEPPSPARAPGFSAASKNPPDPLQPWEPPPPPALGYWPGVPPKIPPLPSLFIFTLLYYIDIIDVLLRCKNVQKRRKKKEIYIYIYIAPRRTLPRALNGFKWA